MTVAEASRNEGIGVQTLYNWRDKAKQQGRPVSRSKPTSEHWSTEAKFATVLETGVSQVRSKLIGSGLEFS